MSGIDPGLPENLRRAVIGIYALFGSMFLIAGLAAAGGVAWVLYLAFEEPKRFDFRGGPGGAVRAVRGTIDGQAFEIELGEPVFWLLTALIGALVLAVAVSIAKKLIATGIELLRPVLAELRKD